MKIAELLEGTGLWANIHAKRKRIKNGSGERMRKPGTKGAPTKKDFDDSVAESRAGVAVAQSKKTQKKLRDKGYMEAPGHYHKKGQDWEDTTVLRPKKRKS